MSTRYVQRRRIGAPVPAVRSTFGERAMRAAVAYGNVMNPKATRAILGAWMELFGSGSYEGAVLDRTTADFLMPRAKADDLTRLNLVKLRIRARHLERNNPVTRNFLRMVAMNVVGPNGIKVVPRVLNNDGKPAKAINDRISDAWLEWCEDPTLSGGMDFNKFSRVVARETARDGEGLARLWRNTDVNRFKFALEGIDADLLNETKLRQRGIDGPEIRMGIEVDEHARRLAFWLWDRAPSVFSGPPNREQRIAADEMVYMMDPDYTSQTRGVTWFASVLLPLLHLDRYIEAELIASRVEASKMGFFTHKDTGSGTIAVNEEGLGEMEANPGTFGILPPGVGLEKWDPSHPNSAYGAFIKDTMRRIAVGLGVSYNALASDLENVNYSSMRSGLLIERDLWRTLQADWISGFTRRIYREWMNVALLSGALRLDSRDARKFYAADFVPRGFPWVDPLKDMQATILGVQSGLADRTTALGEQGIEFADTLRHLKAEKEDAAAAGVDISGPAKVTAPKSATETEADMNGKGGANGDGESDRALLRSFRQRMTGLFAGVED